MRITLDTDDIIPIGIIVVVAALHSPAVQKALVTGVTNLINNQMPDQASIMAQNAERRIVNGVISRVMRRR